jgi:hypothetical protein
MVYELLCEHPDLAWFSNYAQRWPAFPQLEILTRLRDISAIRRSGSRFVPSPEEGYPLWDRCGPRDLRDRNGPLTEADVDAVGARCVRALVGAHVRYHRGRRFVNKNTRNSRRVRYLDSIFPDALFLHVIRDPRAVVASLLAVSWWPDLPLWWSDHRTPRALAADGSKPEAVAAEHWVRCVEQLLADKERLPDSRYLEVRYEQFTRSAEAALGDVCAFVGLTRAPRLAEALRRRTVRSQNEKYKTQLGHDELEIVHRIVAPLARRLGYRVDMSERAENGHADDQGDRLVTRE